MSDFFDRYYRCCNAIANRPLAEYNFADVHSYGLDLKIKSFLENYYNVALANKNDVADYLSLWRCEALLSIVKHAKENSLFYKDLNIDFENCLKLLHEEIYNKSWNKNELENKFQNILQDLPFTQASDIAKDSLQFLSIGQNEVEGLVSVETSGTSSENKQRKRVFCSKNDFESTIQFFFFGMQYLLQSKEDKVALLMSDNRVGSIGYLFSMAMQRLNVSCKILGFSNDYQSLAYEISKFGATCLVALPWHMLNISCFIYENNISHSIKKILLSGDTASEQLKNELAKNLNCEVYNHYGTTEFGFGGAVECAEHQGMHLRALDLHFEIVDKELNPLEDGNFGEIVVTSLSREAMPLLRYRLGDRGRIIAKKCPCGSLIPCIEVYGRINQGVQFAEHKFVHLFEFQTFFFNYEKMKIQDFDISICTDKDSLEKILLIGILGADEDNTLKLHRLIEDFANKFELEFFKKDFLGDTKTIKRFYLCKFSEYSEIFVKNMQSKTEFNNYKDKCLENSSLEDFINQKTKVNIITTKKIIRNFIGFINV